MILPADSYIVINKNTISDIDKKTIIDLYQPLIGNKAVSLYYTLLNDLEKNETITEINTHHHLLGIMQMSLEEIKKSREKLEAIGLLKTYLKKDNINNYIYVIYAPLSPNEFLNHPILNIVLYNNLGKKEYEKIKEKYKTPRISLKDYKDISLKFDEVFSSVPVSTIISNEEIISKNKGEITFKNAIDFELLISGIKSTYINEKAFTKEIRQRINNLSFIYNIDVLTMQNLIKTSINEKGTIDKETLRKSARNFYQFENSGNLPSLIYSKQPEHLKTPTGDVSNKAKMIYTFENTNPYQFIKSKQKDGKIIKKDLLLIEELLIDLKLTPGVVNVLLDYVLRVNNKKLNKSYVETIASHWKRLGIETVEEAMNICIKEHKKTMKKVIPQNKTTEKVPDWFDEQINKEKLQQQEEEELKDLLKQYS